MEIPLNLIQPSPRPVRTSWDEDKMNELAQSIKEQGVIVPIKVRENGDGYEIVYGHRRVEACRRAGCETVQALVEGMEADQALIQALIENILREDMNDADKGRAVLDMNMTNREAAQVLGVQLGQLAAWVALAKDNELAEMFTAHNTNDHENDHEAIRDVANKAGAIRAATKDTPELKRPLANKVIRENLAMDNVRKVAEAVKAAPTPELKRRLIETPYNPVIHNPEVVREVAKYPDRPKTDATGFEWESRPEVAAVFETLKQLEKRLETIESSLSEWKRTVDIGKFSPEGIPFFVGRLRRTSGKLHTTARRIEDLAEWIGREHG